MASPLMMQQSFTIPINHQGKEYSLKLKINLSKPGESTAKLTDEGQKIYKIASNCIIWIGLEEITSPQKLTKNLFKTASFITIIPPDATTKQFQICIPLKQERVKGQILLLSVKTLKDFRELLNLYSQRSALYFDSNHISHQFTEMSSWTISEIAEMVALLEFQAEKNQKCTIDEFARKTLTIETVVTAIELLIAKKYLNCHSLAEPLQKAFVDSFAGKPMLMQEDIKLLIRIFEHFKAEHQSVLIDKLATACQPLAEEYIVAALMEALKMLQRTSYRNASIQRTNLNQNSCDSLLKTLSKSAIKVLLNNQITKLSETHRLDTPTLTCYLTYLTTLMEVAIASDLKHLSAKKDFKNIRAVLLYFTEKKFLERFKQHSETRSTDLRVEFLAQYALYLLQMIGDDENPSYKDLRRVFYVLRGLATVAAGVSIDQPWQILKSLFDSAHDFHKAFTCNDKISKDFIHLNLLQAAYLGGKPESLKDFEKLADALLNPLKSEVGYLYSTFSVHERSNFVLGFLELLQMIHQSYAKDFPNISKKAIDLIRLIKTNNSPFTVNMLFRLEPKKVNSDIRDFVFNEASRMLNKINNPLASCTSSPQETNRLFPLVFHRKFFWIKSLQQQLEELNADEQFKEDEPYIVDLKGEFRSVKGSLKDQLQDALQSKNLIVIAGELGSGKTLFLKKYIKDLLDRFQPGDPIPFYFSLGSMKSKKEMLLQTILNKYGLKDYEEELKKLPTVWFLDAFDELFLGTTKKPFNIYQKNAFQDWPNAQFVYTCRLSRLGHGDVHRYFAPPGGKVPALLTVFPFGDKEITSFFQKYIEKNNASWDIDRYRKSIDELGLTTIIRTPYYLRQIADYLPILNAQLQSLKTKAFTTPDGVESQKEEAKEELEKKKELLLDQLVTYIIIGREVIKVNVGGDILKPSEYLDYAVRVSWWMHICGLKTVPKKEPGQETSVEGERRNSKRHKLCDKQNVTQAHELLCNLQLNDTRNQMSEDKIKEIQNTLKKCKETRVEISKKLGKIEEIEQAESRLQDLLHGDQFQHLRTDALIKLTPSSKVAEFAHPLLYDYFLDLNMNKSKLKNLRDSIDEINGISSAESS